MLKFQSAYDEYFDLTLYRGFNLEAALLDMDGILYDSMPNHTKAWHRLMTELGIKCTPEEFLMFEGMTGEDTIKMLFKKQLDKEVSTEEAREIYRRKTEYFSELPEIQVMPGAREMLEVFKSNGTRLAVVTGSGQRSLIDRLDRDFPGMFKPDMIVTSRDVTNGKPNSEPFFKGMIKARTNPWNCIAVDNAPLGVTAAKWSGAFTVGVTTGPLPENALKEAGAELVFPSMTEFADNLPILIEELKQFYNPSFR